MNIVQLVTRSDAPGGAQAHVRDLSAALLDRGHEVTVLVGGQGPFYEQLIAKGIPVRSLRYLAHPIRPCKDVAAFLELRECLTSLSPDIVAAHSSKAGWLGRLAARSLGLPAVFTAHGWAFTDGVPKPNRQIYLFAERLAARMSASVITVSEYDRSIALSLNVVPAGGLTVVRNGVPDVQASLQRAALEAEPPRLIMVARFAPPKDHACLIRALANLVEYEWTLDLVGDGPTRPTIERMVSQHNLSRRVRFVGERTDVADLLSESTVFVLASKWEGLPISILEAMRAGLPVVATAVGGVPELVVHGETGFLVPSGDRQALAESLKIVLCRLGERKRLGLAGRNRFAQEFSFDTMVESTLEVYQSASSRASKRRCYPR